VPSRSIARSKHRGIKREIVRVIASIRGTVSKPGGEKAELRRGVVVEAWGSSVGIGRRWQNPVILAGTMMQLSMLHSKHSFHLSPRVHPRIPHADGEDPDAPDMR
jgi:hypothetical protein